MGGQSSSKPAAARLVLLLLLLASSPVVQAATYVEEFTTTQYKDPVLTAAWWDTAGGALKLHPFEPAIVGSLSGIGSPFEVTLDGNVACVAAQSGGLVILDVTDPENPSSIASLATPNAQSVAVAGEYAFVADVASGLIVVDISNPAAPSVAGQYDSPGNGLSVVLAGDYAFLADGASGLRVVDISDPTHPVSAGVYDTPGEAKDVCVAGNFAFVADRAGGLQVIDVTDPRAPTLEAYATLPGDPWGINISGDHAFVSSADAGVVVVDISIPQLPAMVGLYNTPGSARQTVIDGDYAYVADYGYVHVLDITDPAVPTLLNTVDTPGIASNIALTCDRAFLAAGNGGGLQVLRIAIPTQPALVRRSNGLLGLAIAIHGNYAYVPVNYRLMTYDISDPDTPILADMLDLPESPSDIAVDGDHAYLPCWGGGVLVVDIKNPVAPYLTGTCAVPHARLIRVDGDLAFVAAQDSFTIVDVSDPTFPRRLGSFYTNNAYGIDLSGDFAYVGNIAFGLEVFDVSDPSTPTLVRTVGGHAYWVTVEGDYAYTGYWDPETSSSCLKVYDISDRANPVPVGQYGDQIGARLNITGDDGLFVTTDGLHVLDLSDPAHPTLEAFCPLPYDNREAECAGDFAYVADCGNPQPGISVVRLFDRQFEISLNTAVSLPIAPGQLVSEVQLVTTQTDSIRWEVTADPDGHWQEIPPTPGWTLLEYPGTLLKWRSTHVYAGAGNPSCGRLQIDYRTGTGVASEDLPGSPVLHPGEPNPFTPATTFRFDLPQSAPVELRIFDPSGRMVATLAKGTMGPGRFARRWDGRADDGTVVACGVYLARLSAGDVVATRRVVLLR